MWVLYLILSILLTFLCIGLFIYWMVIVTKKDYYGHYYDLYYKILTRKKILGLVLGYIGIICITVWVYSLMVTGYKEAILNQMVQDTVNSKENITRITHYNNQPISELNSEKFKNYEITDKLKYKGKIYLGIGTKNGIVLLELDKDKVPNISNTLDYISNVTVNLDNLEIHKIVYVQNIFDNYENTTKKQRKKLLNSNYKDSALNVVDVFDIQSDDIQELKNIASKKHLVNKLSDKSYDILDKYNIERIRFN